MRLKYLILGLVSGALLATAGTSIAAPVIEKVTATIRPDFDLQIDGEIVQLENAPLNYNGASYLPVRELSTLLGKDVDFQDNTIILRDHLPEVEEWITLSSLVKDYDFTIRPSNTDIKFFGLMKDDKVLLIFDYGKGFAFTPEGQYVDYYISTKITYISRKDLEHVGILTPTSG
ncbi:hypothetical protein [Paenibacillus sp. PAMC21692]|uniref:hypothetical protein n=1 Tax=Paenibacillus sp. PAMC21692 TaxID=2762320 RepID=UPI00164D10EE|nr:hypothetical protein [Paenibacillus sp. PAMC21692]QNK57099.1 hypothetical protein H7F31_32210 [Paenibacillus sp. PAMC21692]